MVRTQILKARSQSGDNLLERGNTRTSKSKLTFNITYYSTFQNVRSILEELQVLVAPYKEHKKDFPEVPIVGFRNRERCLSSVYHIITTNTFATKACGEVFKIQSGVLNCNSEKFLYLLRCKICDDTPYVRKAKTKFCLRFNNFKSKH